MPELLVHLTQNVVLQMSHVIDLDRIAFTFRVLRNIRNVHNENTAQGLSLLNGL
jgi:hypothetical protein